MLEHGADITDSQNKYVPDESCSLFADGGTPLTIVCAKNNERIIRTLIEHKANVRQRGLHHCTPLTIACQQSNEAVFQYLVEHNAIVNNINEDKPNINKYIDDDNVSDDNKNSPLINSCQHGHEKIVNLLIEHGANVNQKSQNGLYTPLLWACRNGQEILVKCLLNHGAEIHLSNRYGLIPLICACYHGHFGIVKCLVKYGANIYEEEDFYHHTPVIMASRHKNKILLNYLIYHNAIPIKINNNNEEAKIKDYMASLSLIDACAKDDFPRIKYLLALGVNMKDTNRERNTPLLIACKTFTKESQIKYIVDQEADLNQVNHQGQTPLMCACQQGQTPELIEYLLERGAKKKLRDNKKRTVLFYAFQQGHSHLVRCLLNHDAYVNLSNLNEKRDSILHYACMHDYHFILKYWGKRNKTPLYNEEEWGKKDEERIDSTIPLMTAICHNTQNIIIKYIFDSSLFLTSSNNNENRKKKVIPLLTVSKSINDKKLIVRYTISH